MAGSETTPAEVWRTFEGMELKIIFEEESDRMREATVAVEEV